MSLPKFNPDELEDKKSKEYKEGEYYFEVKNAKDEGKSQSGYDKISLELTVDVGDDEAKVYNYFTYHPNALYKLKEFYESVGITSEGGQPEEIDEFICLSGKAKFVMKPSHKDKTKLYLAVDYFIPHAEKDLNALSSEAEETKKVFESPTEPADIPL